MANCIAKACGEDSSREKHVHRLGSQSAWVQAATWQTFVTAYVAANGMGWIKVEQNGTMIHSFDFGPESLPPAIDKVPPNSVMHQFAEWLDAYCIAELIAEELSDNGKEVTLENMQTIWLCVLEELFQHIRDCVNYRM